MIELHNTIVKVGIDMEGRKDVLGMYVGQNESAKFWLSILNGLKNRGVEDILIACVDGLTGFPQAIEAVFPQTEIQQCIIYQIRNTTKFVSYKEIKPLMSDLKRVYANFPLNLGLCFACTLPCIIKLIFIIYHFSFFLICQFCFKNLY